MDPEKSSVSAGLAADQMFSSAQNQTLPNHLLVTECLRPSGQALTYHILTRQQYQQSRRAAL
jgi:hypothetical protein